ncbi:unnamed protein product, partial [Strongylus vulgaris]
MIAQFLSVVMIVMVMENACPETNASAMKGGPVVGMILALMVNVSHQDANVSMVGEDHGRMQRKRVLHSRIAQYVVDLYVTAAILTAYMELVRKKQGPAPVLAAGQALHAMFVAREIV